MTLTSKEFIILAVVALLVISVVTAVLKKSIRFLLSIWMVFVIASLGFFWLPDKVQQWTSGEATMSDTINGVISGQEKTSMDNAINKGKQAVSDSYNSYDTGESWSDAVKNLVKKFSDLPNLDNIYPAD